MSARTKRPNSKKAADRQKMLWPVIFRPEPIRELSEAQILELEAAGQITLTPETRRALNNIIEGWTSHDRALHSPRPAKFRSRLKAIRLSLQSAYDQGDLNREGASAFERQLFHWVLQLEGGPNALSQLASLPQVIEFLLKAEEALPADSGSARPKDDHRFIQYLADQFEASGGKARGYLSSHSGEGYAKTPFRQFVHRFYGFLLIRSRRTQRGLDEAIRQALIGRRRRKTV